MTELCFSQAFKFLRCRFNCKIKFARNSLEFSFKLLHLNYCFSSEVKFSLLFDKVPICLIRSLFLSCWFTKS